MADRRPPSGSDPNAPDAASSAGKPRRNTGEVLTPRRPTGELPSSEPPTAAMRPYRPSGESSESVTPPVDPVKDETKDTAPHAPIRDSGPQDVPAVTPVGTDPIPDARAPLGAEPDTNVNPLAAPLFTRIPRTWEPDAAAKSKAPGPVKAVELANFGGPAGGTEGNKQTREAPPVADSGAVPVPMPEELDEEIPTNVNPAFLETAALPKISDDPQVTPVGTPPIKRTRSKEVETTPVAPKPRTNTGQLLSDRALADEMGKEKRRDLHVALLIGALGVVLIGVVYRATMYEEPPQMTKIYRPDMKGQGGGGSGAGGKGHGLGGKGKGRGGSEVVNPFKKVAEQTPVANDCASRCSQKQQVCANNCGAAGKCRENCLDSLTRCQERCGQFVGESKDVDDEDDCFTSDGRKRRCTTAEQRKMQEQAEAAMKTLCRLSTGELTVCPKDAAKYDAAAKAAEKYCGPDGCVGDSPDP